MVHIPPIKIADYHYNLPAKRIAQYPLKNRDESKLLVYKGGHLSEDRFLNLADYLPQGARMVFNETRVVQARLEFYKDTGALIEIFCLEPIHPTREIQEAFEVKGGASWKCLVGNSKKWKSGKLTHRFDSNGLSCVLEVVRKEQSEEYSTIDFSWNPAHMSFSEILLHAGLMPLPPYMKRNSEDADKLRYQTIYARHEGSVAAPTAGLHFSEKVFAGLDKKSISRHKVTLHVGAGTFKPVTTETIQDHDMHTEQVRISKETLESLIQKDKGRIVAVGTTTLRTLESVYWYGVKLLDGSQQETSLDVQQWDPYRDGSAPDIHFREAYEAVLINMEKNNIRTLTGKTQLLIAPGYNMRVADILITNFHMPQSTLLLLVSAFIGKDWEKVYQYALDHDFRFLSYGDSCLFFKNNHY